MVEPIFDPADFESYCRTLTIESRDEGLVKFRLNMAQIKVVTEITRCLEEGRHTICILKNRQVGMSTLGLALDLYWGRKHPGIHGSLVTNTDSNRETFRTTLDCMIGEGARKEEGPVLKHNREHLVFKNRSRLIYQVAGERDTGGSLGRGKGLNYCHATETSSWASPELVDSLSSSFSQKYPHRLYFFESTARGFNHWYDMCQTAKRSGRNKGGSQALIFVTWWMGDECIFGKDSNEYRVYGSESPSPQEREWMNAVKTIYKHKITRGQLAWWRWMQEDQGHSMESMLEDFPPIEELAWVMSGAQFFSTQSLTKLMTACKRSKPRGYTYEIGGTHDELQRRNCEYTEPQLLVWEEPVAGAVYVIGADPSGGTGGMGGDDGVIEVLRCYGDGVEQVAEFRAPGMPGYCFAWIINDLSMRYNPCILNLEINNAGVAVADELARIEFRGSYYIYRKVDSLGGNGALHWRTTQETKRWVMEQLRGIVEQGRIEVRSEVAVSQMRKIEQDGAYIGASTKAHGDDCVMGLALAVEAWTKNYLAMLQAQGIMRPKRDEKGNTSGGPRSVLDDKIRDVLEEAGLVSGEAPVESAFGEAFYPGQEFEGEQLETF